LCTLFYYLLLFKMKKELVYLFYYSFFLFSFYLQEELLDLSFSHTCNFSRIRKTKGSSFPSVIDFDANKRKRNNNSNKNILIIHILYAFSKHLTISTPFKLLMRYVRTTKEPFQSPWSSWKRKWWINQTKVQRTLQEIPSWQESRSQSKRVLLRSHECLLNSLRSLIKKEIWDAIREYEVQ